MLPEAVVGRVTILPCLPALVGKNIRSDFGTVCRINYHDPNRVGSVINTNYIINVLLHGNSRSFKFIRKSGEELSILVNFLIRIKGCMSRTEDKTAALSEQQRHCIVRRFCSEAQPVELPNVVSVPGSEVNR
jgi:hypothetical protein